eukprot:365091-Chlamydomonas_euryale.AAC.15
MMVDPRAMLSTCCSNDASWIKAGEGMYFKPVVGSTTLEPQQNPGKQSLVQGEVPGCFGAAAATLPCHTFPTKVSSCGRANASLDEQRPSRHPPIAGCSARGVASLGSAPELGHRHRAALR